MGRTVGRSIASTRRLISRMPWSYWRPLPARHSTRSTLTCCLTPAKLSRRVCNVGLMAVLSASWDLTWPGQKMAGVAPVTLYAYYGTDFLHPHLRGSTVRDWPLNVFTIQDAANLLPILRAIATSDLHNLVFPSGLSDH